MTHFTAQKYTLPKLMEQGSPSSWRVHFETIQTGHGLLHRLQCITKQGTYTRTEMSGFVQYWQEENPNAAPYKMHTGHPMVKALDDAWTKDYAQNTKR